MIILIWPNIAIMEEYRGSTGGLPDSQGDDRDNVGGDYSRLIFQ